VAASVPRRPIELRECAECGLVFNAAYGEGHGFYDSGYENRQSHSKAFRRHLTWLSTLIGAYLDTARPRILEVGCGKGQFLQQLAEMTGGEAEGYDTTYEGPNRLGDVTFYKEYLSAERVRGHFDAIICRHVIEHVPTIGSFLASLAKIARAAGDPPVFLETPRLEWILQHKSAWDIFYEHCNYFTEAALAGLCSRYGFKVLAHLPAFARQYQVLILEPDRADQDSGASVIHAIAQISQEAVIGLSRVIERESAGGTWAIWGAGAKGACLANRLPPGNLCMIFDTNPAKHGCYVPGTRIPIVAPTHEALASISLVVIMNPAYQDEIREQLGHMGYRGRVLVLDESFS